MTTENNITKTADATGQAQSDRAPRPGRRHFLKGTALALPAAMTLTPGTAQALASVTCGQKALDSNLSAPVLVTDADDQMRQSVDVYDQMELVTDGQGNTSLQPNGVPTYFFDNVQSVWRDVAGTSLGAGVPSDRGPAPIATRLAIVHIDATDGSPRSVGAGTAPSNAIITSAAGLCMTSLMGHNP